MTPDLIRLAREAGVANVFMTPQFAEVFERFAALVAEECAKVCEELLHKHCEGTQSASDPQFRCNPGDEACDFVAAWTDAAQAIRGKFSGKG